jgi:hypothetical protein
MEKWFSNLPLTHLDKVDGVIIIKFVGLTFEFYKFNDEFAKGVVMGELLIGSLSIFNIKLHFIQKVEIK